MPRSLRSGRDGVVAHTPCFKTHFETFRCERPPRRFAPPLLCKEGNVPTPELRPKKQEGTTSLSHLVGVRARVGGAQFLELELIRSLRHNAFAGFDAGNN